MVGVFPVSGGISEASVDRSEHYNSIKRLETNVKNCIDNVFSFHRTRSGSFFVILVLAKADDYAPAKIVRTIANMNQTTVLKEGKHIFFNTKDAARTRELFDALN